VARAVASLGKHFGTPSHERYLRGVSELAPDRYAEALRDQTARLVELVRDTDLSRWVPSCPEWDVRRLVEHVGQAHRLGAELVERRASGPPEQRNTEQLPEEPVARDQWLIDGADRLIKAVQDAGPDCPVWNFNYATQQRALFWLRRMTHETAVHRADAALTLDAPFELEPELASDAVSEWLMLASSPGAAAARPEVAAAMRGTGETLHLHATDEPSLGEAGEWLIRRDPSEVSWEHGHQKGDVAVRGRAVDLLLALLGRIPPDDERLTVFGDAELFQHWVRHVHF
jgi:uncharacterized protein (TIGR03083 family)